MSRSFVAVLVKLGVSLFLALLLLLAVRYITLDWLWQVLTDEFREFVEPHIQRFPAVGR